MKDREWRKMKAEGEWLKEKGNIDKECWKLVDAINRLPGLCTIESCCGHGTSFFMIKVSPRKVVDLVPLLYYLDECHNTFSGWWCEIYTDCAMQPPFYSIVGPKGAYEEADQIAKLIREWLDSPEAQKRQRERRKRRWFV